MSRCGEAPHRLRLPCSDRVLPVPARSIEPTESESKAELDRFREAMIQVHREMRQLPPVSPMARIMLKNAPHTSSTLGC